MYPDPNLVALALVAAGALLSSGIHGLPFGTCHDALYTAWLRPLVAGNAGHEERALVLRAVSDVGLLLAGLGVLVQCAAPAHALLR